MFGEELGEYYAYAENDWTLAPLERRAYSTWFTVWLLGIVTWYLSVRLWNRFRSGRK
jgi:hypothetical protein